jgi:hypothetical protein
MHVMILLVLLGDVTGFCFLFGVLFFGGSVAMLFSLYLSFVSLDRLTY